MVPHKDASRLLVGLLILVLVRLLEGVFIRLLVRVLIGYSSIGMLVRVYTGCIEHIVACMRSLVTPSNHLFSGL